MPRSDQNTKTVIWTAVVVLAACGPQSGGPKTYAQDVKPIVDASCAGCHVEGGIAPFSLTTYAQVKEQRFAIAAATKAKTMPPVLAAKGCADYANDLSLSDEQIATLEEWAGSDALEGEAPAAQEPPSPGTSQAGLSRVDLELPMPIVYTPQKSPDDYRCFVMDWPSTGFSYVTGFRAKPGNAKVVHHVIAYLAGPEYAAEFAQLDADEPGPGYTCFGGANGDRGGTGWLGAWAPGAIGGMYPEGTGILVRPGSKVILQVHYNTLGKSGDFSDRTTVELAIAETVKHRSAYVPFTNFAWIRGGGMTIPAHESDVVHTYSVDPTPFWGLATAGALPNGVALKVHSAAAHQHLLGTKNKQQILRKDGTSECLLDIPRWDFHWQQAYWLEKPKLVKPGDKLEITCHWDNSSANQPVVDGKRLEPRTADWGESTTDEMCLGLLYVSE